MDLPDGAPSPEFDSSGHALTASIEGENFSIVSGSQSNGTYFGRSVRAFWTNGTASTSFYSATSKNTTINIVVMGTACPYSTPTLEWTSGNQGGGLSGVPTSYSSNTFPIHVNAGWNSLTISMRDDYAGGGCDRNMFVDFVHIWD